MSDEQEKFPSKASQAAREGRGMNAEEAMWEILGLKDKNDRMAKALARSVDHLNAIVREKRGLEATAEVAAYASSVCLSTCVKGRES